MPTIRSLRDIARLKHRNVVSLANARWGRGASRRMNLPVKPHLVRLSATRLMLQSLFYTVVGKREYARLMLNVSMGGVGLWRLAMGVVNVSLGRLKVDDAMPASLHTRVNAAVRALPVQIIPLRAATCLGIAVECVPSTMNVSMPNIAPLMGSAEIMALVT